MRAHGRNLKSFYLIDERTEDGGPLNGGASAEGHAKFLSGLLQREHDEVPWYASFARGKGYIKV
jgi:hypothetical protein